MNPSHTQQKRWYCLRSQLKRERIAAEHLRQLDGVEVFAPRIRYRKSTARGRIWWQEPLFPGYVMARFDLDSLGRQVCHCTGVSHLVSFGRVVPSIADTFITQLQTELAADAADETFTTSPLIEVGDEVRVGEGPLCGMSGTVVQVMPATERVRVLLEFLGEDRAMDLDILSLILPRRPLPNQISH